MGVGVDDRLVVEKAVTLYFLEWDNGLDFPDHQVMLLGVYLSNSRREEAKARYDAGKRKDGYYPFCSGGQYVEYEVELDVDLV